MRRLVLFRHAKAEARSAGGEDFGRALTARGLADAAMVGRLIAERGFAPDLALVSSAQRARETWEAARAAFPGAEAEVRDGLYNASPEEIAAEVERVAASAETVMVIGHNPGLQEVAVGLLSRDAGSAVDVDRLASHFPTSMAVMFGFDSADRAVLEAVCHPKDPGSD